MPLYRAAHRHPGATVIRLRQSRNRRDPGGPGEELARPEVLDSAIQNDQLRLFYHPIVDLAGTTVVGHEVLIRWQHPALGLLAPIDFLPAIDRDADLSRRLGNWVLQASCAAAIERGDYLHLSVNISPLHLAFPGFADHVTQVLRGTGFAPARLILELTDASLVEPAAAVAETCQQLRELGVTFALDDFAVGRVEPEAMDRLPLDILKLDRDVTAAIGTDVQAQQLVVEALELAKSTGRRTIAVGVETHDQARFLREHDATYAQGYLYGRPKPR